MEFNYITDFLNLKDIFVSKVVHSDSKVSFYIETNPSTHICPRCGSQTSKIHDYRNQTIKDLPFQFKQCFLILRKRRYACSCGKRFLENYSFLPRYHQHTSRLSEYILHKLRDCRSLKSIAKDVNLSTPTIQRILNMVSFSKPSLPKALSIDEFKGDTNGEKYQCILVDPSRRNVLDILPDRKWASLSGYFRSFPKQERYQVQFFSCDMWKPYADLAKTYFPNAKIIIDKYHFIRQVTWAIEKVRKRLQKTMPASLRKYYKRSRSLMLKHYHSLNPSQKQACDLMLLYNDDLRKAHWLKESFHTICQTKQYSKQRADFVDWIREAENSGIPEFVDCANTYRNWKPEILNAFKYHWITNGPTEGFNNKIKVLKRVSYGLKDFKRFRNRILLVTN